mgnify:CR=1 FL=1
MNNKGNKEVILPIIVLTSGKRILVTKKNADALTSIPVLKDVRDNTNLDNCTRLLAAKLLTKIEREAQYNRNMR